MKTLSLTRFFIEKYLRLVVKESTSEIVALRKLKINPLKNFPLFEARDKY